MGLKIETVATGIPVTRTVTAQAWLREWGHQFYVRIRDESGTTGIGEILTSAGNTPAPYKSLIDILKPFVESIDNLVLPEIWDSLRRLTFSGGYGVTTGAISGIDIALWDLLGKRTNRSISDMVGRKRDVVARYASLSRYKSPELAVKAVEDLVSKGYRAIKLHQTKDNTLETARLVRKSLGFEFDLMADMNCSMAYDAARKFMKEAGRYELKWVEEPVWPPDDFDSLKKLNQIGPVAAGENFFSIFEFRRLLEDGCLSFYQPDVAKIGGVTPYIELMKLFKSYKASLSFHNRPNNGWVGLMTSANLASSFDGWCIVESPPNELPKVFGFSGKIDKTTITPSGPGHGITFKGRLPKAKKQKLLRFH